MIKAFRDYYEFVVKPQLWWIKKHPVAYVMLIVICTLLSVGTWMWSLYDYTVADMYGDLKDWGEDVYKKVRGR